MRILYLTSEQWPTYRADVTVLFGKYLPALDIHADLVTDTSDDYIARRVPAWQGGDVIGCAIPASRARQHLAKLWHNIRAALSLDVDKYDCIQVRDMSLSALVALLAARIKGGKFTYWLSYLQFEGHVERARSRGRKAGARYWYPLVVGMTGQWILYKLVLPRADHVFVQSACMRDYLCRKGVPAARMTPVPMGVDAAAAHPGAIVRSSDPRLHGRRVLVYLGTQDRARQLEVLLRMLAIVRRAEPDVLLVMAGDTEDDAHRAWLHEEAKRCGVEDCVLWTGWLPMEQSWSYVQAADIGLSPVPRNEILDAGSPTKTLEYLAFGVPVVGNDNPDQKEVIESSGGGVCTALDAEQMAAAVVRLLSAPDERRHMGELGREYVIAQRGYEQIARDVAQSYRRMLARRQVTASAW